MKFITQSGVKSLIIILFFLFLTAFQGKAVNTAFSAKDPDKEYRSRKEGRSCTDQKNCKKSKKYRQIQKRISRSKKMY